MKISKYTKGMNGDNAFMEKEEYYTLGEDIMEQYGPKPAGIASAFSQCSYKKKIKTPKIKPSRK